MLAAINSTTHLTAPEIGTSLAAPPAGRPPSESFLGALGRAIGQQPPDLGKLRAMTQLGRPLDPAAAETPRQAAALLLSQLFFAPLLAEARKLPFGGSVGSGGRGEEVFGEQLDLRIADTVASSLRSGLTSHIENRLRKTPNRSSTVTP